jgi:hypothetical protein
VKLAAILSGALMLAGLAGAQGPRGNYDESKVGQYTLPDPLVFNDGTAVRTAKDWTDRRRAEILELFAGNVYGHNPPAPSAIKYEVFDLDQRALAGKAIRKQVSIYLSDKNGGPKEDLLMYVPAAAKKPAPVILLINFAGNQMYTSDPAVRLPMLWDRRTHQQERAREESRGRAPDFDLEQILSRGYAFATLCYQDIEPDFNGGYQFGIRPLFLKPGQTAPGPDEWGAIGAWAYGLSRAMDYLEKDQNVDARRVTLVGHSRLGKTALWAGALDQRFAIVIASCSGEGGASLARRDYGETVADLVKVFPYWFCPNYAKFATRVNDLPVDAHELIALIAPRPVYITGAEEDQWADPRGEFLAAVAAGPVYRLLGKDDLGTTEMPALNKPIMHTIGFHYRTGKHAVTAFDWEQFLAFADMHQAAAR